MGSKAIKIENLSKAYQVGDFSSGTISRDLERYWALLRGKEDPFLKIGETNDRTQAGDSDIVWSLKDINLEIEQGDAVGIIGRNGAGKSTLLKILSRVTSPTTGSIKVKGRIASLLEVGTGFHPELTGRENIYLNGAILGMRKAEIKRKFDEIVSFAGIERYIDTPVKRYSSGMYVRLAFAVAAHLESEILIVDEVLAVGDAEFQKKCLGKMGDVSKGEGRTVLFVSHNMGLINQLCDTSAYLKSGQLVCFAKTKSVIDDYLLDRQNFKERLSVFFNAQESDDNVFLHGFEIIPHYQNQRSFDSGRQIELKFTFHIKKPIDGLRLGFELISPSTEQCIFRTFHDDSLSENQALQEGKYRMIAHIPACLLNEGQYIITPTIGIHNIKWLSFRDHQLLIDIINMTGINQLYSDSRPGYLALNLKWEIEHEKIDVYIVQKVINVLDKYNRRRKKNELSAWDKNVLNADKFVYQLSNSLKIILHKDSLLSKLIFEGFEHDEELFISRFIKQGDIFFDVGANIGMHTLFAAHTLNGTGKVYAFEPTPATVKRLRENVALNKLVDCVNIEPVGLSNQAGELNLNLAANGYDAWNSFANLKHIEVKDSIIVPVVTLDEFIESYSIEISHISLIKIDVEGWEIKVFEGMRRLFDNNLFKATFLIEFTEENMFRAGYSCKELYNYLVDKGYKWYEFDPQSNSIKFSELKAYYPYQNLIATKNPEAVNARLKEAKKMGHNYPKISIITPPLIKAKFLEETILSVINQGYPKLEFIIIDGGSTDASVDIIRKYNKYISFWSSEKDNGQAEAINKGLLRATGDVVTWLNSDDLYEDGTLLLIGEIFAENPSVNFIFGDCLFFTEKKSYTNQIDLKDFEAKQLGQFPYSQPSCFFRKKLIDDQGLLNEKFHYCLDVDLFIRFALNSQMRYIKKTLSRFRMHDDSKTINHWNKFLEEWIVIYSKTLRTLNNKLLIECAIDLGIYDKGTDVYNSYEKPFNIDDQYKSFYIFLKGNLIGLFRGYFFISKKKLNAINKILAKIDSADIQKEQFPIKPDKYLLGIDKTLLHPVNMLRRTIKKTSSFNVIRDAIFNVKAKTSATVKAQIKAPKTIPIIIINYNQLHTVEMLINSLTIRGYYNIHILDNNSDYEPLLAFYRTTNANVIRLNYNYGHMALWRISTVNKKFSEGYYAVTDADIVPDENCPDDFMSKFIDILDQHPGVTKAGFGLRIDDIPEHYQLKQKVIDWERKYWTTEISPGLYDADIDTTFALYRPYNNLIHRNFLSGIRTASPYLARHLSWYQCTDTLTNEQLHYIKTANISNSWSLKLSESNYQDF